MPINVEHDVENHDPKTCLGCRFYELLKELYPVGINNETYGKIMTMFAYLIADILADGNPANDIIFIAQLSQATVEARSERKENENEEEKTESTADKTLN